jgi:hypothetical protein
MLVLGACAALGAYVGQDFGRNDSTSGALLGGAIGLFLPIITPIAILMGILVKDAISSRLLKRRPDSAHSAE